MQADAAPFHPNRRTHVIKWIVWPCAIFVLGTAPAANAASDSELAEIRAQIRELKDQYEARIKALEDRLESAEARASDVAAAPAPAAATSQSSISAFNPAISAILAGQYANLSADSTRLRLAGFPTSSGVDVGKRGFSLSESELQLSANVDHLFAGNLVFSISPENTVEVEEAYGIFNGAPSGL